MHQQLVSQSPWNPFYTEGIVVSIVIDAVVKLLGGEADS